MRTLPKHVFSRFFCLLLVFSLLPTIAFAKTYTDRNEVDGSYYTSRPNLISKLNQIFDGNASVYTNYSCTSLVNTCIGRRAVKNNGVTMYVGGSKALNSGTSCWIYANGVYYTLFGEVTGNGDAGKNSTRLNLTGNKKFTYNNFVSWGVRNEPGALVRVGGHSLIILKYDSSKIYYLDGNGDNQGIIAVREYYWSDCPWYNKTVSYVIQPTAQYFNDLYPYSQPSPPSASTSYLDKCTYYPSAGTAKIRVPSAWIKSYPCSKGTDSSSKDVAKAYRGNNFQVTGLYKNTEGNYWYQIRVNGQTAYVFHEHVTLQLTDNPRGNTTVYFIDSSGYLRKTTIYK